ncbi:MAG: hypothetical protein IPK08_00045 [Bacteroidetes bacterium]|nr:hypothetical protein [Bacteroidota bacterium]MBK9423153.1 hypothetical protein [Bacteroidota bacterium]
MKYSLTLALILIINVALHGQVLYRNFDPPFIMELPNNWIKEKPIVKGTDLQVRDNKSGCSISVITYSSSELNVKDAHELPLEYLRKDANSPSEEKIIKFEKIYLNNQKTTRLVTEYRYRSLNMDTIMCSTVYAIIKDNYLYRIAIGGEKNQFEKMKPVLEQSVSTFYITTSLKTKNNTVENNIFRSEQNNFTVLFETKPNIDSKENLTTYLVTSLKDSAIYRINVQSNSVLFTNREIHKEYVENYISELATELESKNINYDKIEFNSLQAIEFYGEMLTYGEVPMLGDKAHWKSLIFINGDKIYTLQVTSTTNRLDHNYKAFISNFKFLY